MIRYGKPRFTIGSLAVGLILLGPGAADAQAYIDPGTGSSLFASLGVILGMVTAVFAVGLTQARRIGEWFIAKLTPARKEKPLTPDLAARKD